jgi:hypothetical protein
MSETLQFDRAESAGGPSCGQCRTVLHEHYFQAGGAMLCEGCTGSLQRLLAGEGSSAGRFLRAFFLGVGAMLAGAIGYGLWMGLTHSEFALVTIAIGWLVGKAVRRGSGGRGGWRYGLLAVVLTYCAISLSFLGAILVEGRGKTGPEVAEVHPGAKKRGSVATSERKLESPGSVTANASGGEPTGIWGLVSLILYIPILSAMDSILSLVITGFGLWQAWKMNQAVDIEITGPHRFGEGVFPASA